MSTDKIPTMLRLYPAMRQKLEYLAQEECRTVNGEIEHMISVYIRQYEKENGPISPKES